MAGPTTFITEPDAIAIRPNWLMFFVAEVQVAPCTSFWIKGSVSRCSSEYGDMRRQHNLHINGGSLYCVPPQSDNTVLIALLCAVQHFFPSGFELYVLGVDYVGGVRWVATATPFTGLLTAPSTLIMRVPFCTIINIPTCCKTCVRTTKVFARRS